MNQQTINVVDVLLIVFVAVAAISFLMYSVATREPLSRKMLISMYPPERTINQLLDGDIVFYSSGTKYDLKDHVLRIAGSSHFTHVGIIVTFAGIPYILESVRAGVRVRYAPSNFDHFLKGNKHNSIFVKRFIVPIPNSKLVQSARRSLGCDYSFDFVSGFCDRVFGFLPFEYQSQPKIKSGYSCLSLVLSCLKKELQLPISSLRSLQELFEYDSDCKIWTQSLIYSGPYNFNHSL